MKKYLLVLLVPFTASAIELHPEEECNAIIGDLRQDLQYITNNAFASKQKAEIITNLAHDAWLSLQALSIQQSSQDQIIVNDAIASLNDIQYQGLWVIRESSNIIEKSLQSSLFLDSVDCSACSVASTNCCDFTQIIEAINDVANQVADNGSNIEYMLITCWQELQEIAQQMSTMTNSILSIYSILSSPTNTIIFNPTFGQLVNPALTANGIQYLRGNGVWNTQNNSTLQQVTRFNKENYYDNLIRYFYNQNNALFSINNMLGFTYRTTVPVLTNTLNTIHRDQTNYFSFFRGELGVQGVLADWQSEQVSGSYHDFLTNHYLSVVRGGPLSGNQSTKTNWFSRIETLLAALVFTDSQETNTVDTSAGNRERQQLATSYETANQAAATFSEDFKTTSQSIVSLYRSYFNTFETAAMPSHIVLMKLSSDDSEDIEIAFQSDSLGILVESCRVVTTFCWSSVGIFLLYKFLVWSARCVILACQFIYRAISSVFKS